MQGSDGTEVKHYWVRVTVTLPNGKQGSGYREFSQAQLDKLRQEKREFCGISKTDLHDVERAK